MIKINSFNQTNYQTFRNTDKKNTVAAPKLSDSLTEYEKQRIRNEQNTNDTLKAGFGIITLFLASIAAILALKNNAPKPNKTSHDLSNAVINFTSLKERTDIPILEECKSLDKKLKSFLQKQITLTDISKSNNNNMKPSNRIIMYGPPGVGKSYFAKIFAKTTGAKYAEVRFADINSIWGGENVAKMQSIFENIIKDAKANKDNNFVVVFNEVEASISSIEKLQNNTGYTGHILEKIEERNTFINYMDRLSEECPNVTVIGTTNVNPKDGLDGAVLSRFKQNLIKLDFPSQDSLFEASVAKIKKLNMQDSVQLVQNDEWNNFINRMHKRKSSFRDLNVVIENAAENYMIDKNNLKNNKSFFKHLNESLDSIDLTDGEIYLQKGV